MSAAAGWVVGAAAAACAVFAWRLLAVRAELVARACHELRGPITAARLGLALGERVGALSADRLRAVDLELASAALALDDLAAAGRGAGGAAGLRDRGHEFDLCKLLEDSVHAWRANALGRAVDIVLDCPGETIAIIGDRVRLAQATGNLIANALEHGCGDVVVRASTAGGAARVEFIDSGPGLPAPVATLARRPRRGRGSRGRGLAIALAIAVSHGGRLAAAPSDGGTRIVLELPLAATGARSGAGPAGLGC
jgi:signal transduction histidine kinase